MNAFAILLPVIFPIIAGACLLPVKFSDRKARQRVVLPIIVLNAIFALYAIFCGQRRDYDFPLQQQIVSGTACGRLIQDFRYDGISALDSHNDLCL